MMPKRPSVATLLKKVLMEDPRLAIALVETLGPPPGLTRPTPSTSATHEMDDI